MKLEPVLTMKIVDNFVRFGMPYEASVSSLAWPRPVLAERGVATQDKSVSSLPLSVVVRSSELCFPKAY